MKVCDGISENKRAVILECLLFIFNKSKKEHNFGFSMCLFWFTDEKTLPHRNTMNTKD